MQKYKTVEEFLNDLSEDKRLQVEALRQIILRANPALEEHIKWNAPSYIYEGEDRITFNVLNKEGVARLILHMGALRKEDKKAPPVINDTTGLIAWNSDIRGMLSFQGIEDIHSKSNLLEQIVKQWLKVKT